MTFNLDKLLQGASRAVLALNEAKLKEVQGEGARRSPHKAKRPHGENETEKAFNRSVLDGKGQYEALTFHLPGGSRYTPDYIVWEGSGITAYEVKGSYRLQSEGRALTAFREARAAFPHVTFRWFAKRKMGDGFAEKHRR